jgi:hypothetical protein
MTDIQERLIKEGYVKSVGEHYRFMHESDTLFQKRIKDNKGTRYFINVWWYPERAIGSHTLKEDIQYDITIHTIDDSYDKVVSLEWNSGYTVLEAEELADKLWEVLGGAYYERA